MFECNMSLSLPRWYRLPQATFADPMQEAWICCRDCWFPSQAPIRLSGVPSWCLLSTCMCLSCSLKNKNRSKSQVIWHFPVVYGCSTWHSYSLTALLSWYLAFGAFADNFASSTKLQIWFWPHRPADAQCLCLRLNRKVLLLLRSHTPGDVVWVEYLSLAEADKCKKSEDFSNGDMMEIDHNFETFNSRRARKDAWLLYEWSFVESIQLYSLIGSSLFLDPIRQARYVILIMYKIMTTIKLDPALSVPSALLIYLDTIIYEFLLVLVYLDSIITSYSRSNISISM